jgi:hypothetical protein
MTTISDSISVNDFCSSTLFLRNVISRDFYGAASSYSIEKVDKSASMAIISPSASRIHKHKRAPKDHLSGRVLFEAKFF